jgi:pyrophosphatase PpaX
MRGGPPDAILFDLDGTLIATKTLYLEAYRKAVEPYVREELTQDQIMALKPTSELAFIRAVVAESEFDACLEGFYRAYSDLHPGLFEGVYPGIPEVLDRIRKVGLPMGIVTGKSRRSWDVTREIISLGPFDALIFDDDVRAPKPDPHGLSLALDLLDVAPERAVYVGDTMSDLRAAKSAGLAAVTVLWARAEEERDELAAEALGEGAVAAVARPFELIPILGLDR